MKRKNALDFLRIPAAMAIVMHHYQQNFEAFFPGHINYFGGNYSFGNVVEFFFVLSGFLMLPSVKRIYSGETDFSSFMFRRIRRMLPMLAICALAFDAVEIVSWIQDGFSHPLKITFFMTVADMLGIQGGWCFNHAVVNIPSWYVCVLLLCSVLLFLVVRFCKKTGCKLEYAFVAMVMLGCGVFSYKIELPFFNYASSRGIYSFFFGVLLALLMEKYSFRKAKNYFVSVLILLLSVFDILRGYGDGFLTAFLAAPALIHIFTSPAVERIFKGSIWQTLGNIQFHVYLWHSSLIRLVYVIGRAGININVYNIKMMYAFALFTELFGAVSYFLLEKRADRLFMAFLPKKVQADQN